MLRVSHDCVLVLERHLAPTGSDLIRTTLTAATATAATTLAVLASLLVSSPATSAAPVGAAKATAPTAVAAVVVRWVDGDTVVTNRGTVRLIGVDTPERGKCGYVKARRLARSIAPAGTVVRLGNPRSVRNHDRYGRLLRYVNRGTRDIGIAQIRHGAWARYDSRDGYQHHPRQAKYRRADARHRNYCGKRNPSSKPKTGGSTGGGGAVAPVSQNRCPSYAPIKGNADSMIYHKPGQRYYAVTNPEECFRTAAAAEAAGYRAAKV